MVAQPAWFPAGKIITWWLSYSAWQASAMQKHIFTKKLLVHSMRNNYILWMSPQCCSVGASSFGGKVIRDLNLQYGRGFDVPSTFFFNWDVWIWWYSLLNASCAEVWHRAISSARCYRIRSPHADTRQRMLSWPGKETVGKANLYS